MKNGTFKAIGLMSGSSLDGLDLAYCHISIEDNAVEWQLLQAETIEYDEKWQARLKELPYQNALAFAKTHTYFGHYMAQLVNQFTKKYDLKPDFIASHGHTIYHHPDRRFTTQIGCGAALAALTRTTVINDFRTQDIAIEGEGTPLAPIADKMLFAGYDFYLNLGGIANISADIHGKFVAFDVTFCNQILNALAARIGMSYDANGAIARSGTPLQTLINEVQNISYFYKKYPKSLDNQWIVTELLPLFSTTNDVKSVANALHTACHLVGMHIRDAILQIEKKENLPTKPLRNMFVTGGGAKNTFLTETIAHYCKPKVEVVVPKPQIVDFKEATLMVLLGALRLLERPNCLSSVTGASRDTVGGAVYFSN